VVKSIEVDILSVVDHVVVVGGEEVVGLGFHHITVHLPKLRWRSTSGLKTSRNKLGLDLLGALHGSIASCILSVVCLTGS
jgi:hypothetical protein